MKLLLDIGNTNIVIGLAKDKKLVESWRIQTDIKRTVDEYALILLNILKYYLNQEKPAKFIDTITICSVVPPLGRTFGKISQKYFFKTPLFIDSKIKLPFKINLTDPTTLGADRLVNAISCRENYGYPAVIVDLGTATTFDVLGETGDYEGGMITPGILISAQALFERAAKLPNIDLKKPTNLIGKNTQEAMLSGIVNGYISLVDGLVTKIKAEFKTPLKAVVATGGFSTLIADSCSTITNIDPSLTMNGLLIIEDHLA